jgi:GNAT superfamily N-acetyltransferase
MGITIRLFEKEDIEAIASSFRQIGWRRAVSEYDSYLAEQDRGERVVLVALYNGAFAGYVTIVWTSAYPPFAEEGIPEINDLNVLPAFRRRGVASSLVNEAEKWIFERSPVAGIGVGMHADYGAAQRMYALMGYVPDTRGLFYRGQQVVPGQEVSVDDDLILYLTKEREENPGLA